MKSNPADMTAFIKNYANYRKLTTEEAEAELVAYFKQQDTNQTQQPPSPQRSLPMLPDTGLGYNPLALYEKLKAEKEEKRAQTVNTPDARMLATMEKIMEMRLTFDMMKEGMGSGNNGNNHQPSPQNSPQEIANMINAALDKQAQLFKEELRLLHEKQDREKEEQRREREIELRRRETEKLIQDVTKDFDRRLGTKDETTKLMENKYEQLNKEMIKDRENRHANELKQLKDEVARYAHALTNQKPPAGVEEGLDDYLKKIEAINNFTKKLGTIKGLSNTDIAEQIGQNDSFAQQLLAAAPVIADVIGKIQQIKNTRVPMQQVPPQNFTPAAQHATQPIPCSNCGQASYNGTNICDQCRSPVAQDAPGTVIDPLAMVEPSPPEIIDAEQSEDTTRSL